jgi:hypothetical protein
MKLLKNEVVVRSGASLLQSPWKEATLCALRGKERGDGWLIDDAKLREYDKELSKITQDISRKVNTLALKKTFGENTKFRSIFDYKESAVVDPSDAKEKKDEYNRNRKLVEDEAIRIANRLNEQKKLVPNQSRKMSPNQKVFKYEIAKIQSKLALQKTFGENTTYTSLGDYIPSVKGYSDRPEPSDWKEKYDLNSKNEKEISKRFMEDAIQNDPSILEKSRCLLVGSSIHNRINQLAFGTYLYNNHGFMRIPYSEEKILASSVLDAVNRKYPSFELVPPFDYTSFVYTTKRDNVIEENKLKEEKFIPEAVAVGKKQLGRIIDRKELPEGWYAIENTENSIMITQPLIKTSYAFSLSVSDPVLPSSDLVKKNMSNIKTLNIAIADKENDAWKVSYFGLDKNKDVMVKSKKDVVNALFCYADAKEKARNILHTEIQKKQKETHIVPSKLEQNFTNEELNVLKQQMKDVEKKSLQSCLSKSNITF